jgi:LCP family protein required for cell wall assembly
MGEHNAGELPRSAGGDTEGGEPIWRSGTESAVERRSRWRRTRRVLLVTACVVVVLLGLAVGGGVYLTDSLGGNVHRYPHVFSSLNPASRPPQGPGTDFLLAGVDTRAPNPTTGEDASTGRSAAHNAPDDGRSDVIMVVHVDADNHHGVVMSIPRDSWVAVPGHGKEKINAAYAHGGPSLLVQTVEKLTGLRIDHFGVIDFAGFRAMTKAVGGIDVRVAAPTDSRGVHFHKGVNHLEGRKALVYVRQRYDLPHGDFDREQRQQAALRALMRKVADRGLLSNPVGTYKLLDAVTRSVSVDDSLSNGDLRSLALRMRHLRAADMRFLTAPVHGTGMEGRQSVVYLNKPALRKLSTAIGKGHRVLDHYLASHSADELPAVPN